LNQIYSLKHDTAPIAGDGRVGARMRKIYERVRQMRATAGPVATALKKEPVAG
jgi:hypothetical protein